MVRVIKKKIINFEFSTSKSVIGNISNAPNIGTETGHVNLNFLCMCCMQTIKLMA